MSACTTFGAAMASIERNRRRSRRFGRMIRNSRCSPLLGLQLDTPVRDRPVSVIRESVRSGKVYRRGVLTGPRLGVVACLYSKAISGLVIYFGVSCEGAAASREREGIDSV